MSSSPTVGDTAAAAADLPHVETRLPASAQTDGSTGAMQRLRPVASEALSPTTLSALFSRRPRSVLGELEWVEFRYAGLVRLLAPPDQFSIVQSAHQALLRRAVLSRHLPAVAHSYLGRYPLDVHVLNAALLWATKHPTTVRAAKASDPPSDPHRRHRPENIRTIPALDKRVDRMKRSEVRRARVLCMQVTSAP